MEKKHRTMAVGATLLTGVAIGLLGACGGDTSSGGHMPHASRMWRTPQLLETDDTGDVAAPKLAMNANGSAIAVWKQSDGTRYNARANVYSPTTGWATATLIETDNAGDVSAPVVAMGAGGDGLAVWQQGDGTRTNIWSNRYTAGAGWDAAELIETDNTGNAYIPQVAIDAGGNGLAVWYQSDGARTNIWSNRYTAGTGWGTAELIETDNAGVAEFPQIAVDGAGNGIAVWQQHDGTRYNIWANRYSVGTGWGAAELIESSNAGHAQYPRIALDASGNGLAVWSQYDGVRYNTWANRYTAGAGWGTAELIETDSSGGTAYPDVALNATGNGMAVWQHYDGVRNNIWANRYSAATGWGTAQSIQTDSTGDAWAPRVAVDADGNALAVWDQYDGTRSDIWSNRYRSTTGWSTAELIEIDNAGGAWAPQIAIDGNGNGLAVWYQSDGSHINVWANAYR